MKIRNLLLLLLALFAVSAWAADEAVAPSNPPSAQASINKGSDNSLQSALTPQKAGEASLATEPGSLRSPAVGACPVGCTLMNCPPPGGAPACCKRTVSGYQAC